MGEFLQMAAIAAPRQKVEDALARLEGDEPTRIYPRPNDKSLVMFDQYSEQAVTITQSISKECSVPCFYIHVHDGDIWMYELYVDGESVDRFNTMPDYWEDVEKEVEEEWQGNADIVAQSWPGLTVDSIREYLVNHSKDGIDPESKAYDSDEFPYWDSWQVVDFMKKLGVPYLEESELEGSS